MTMMRVALGWTSGGGPGWVQDATQDWLASHRKHKPEHPKLTIRGTVTTDTVTVPYAPQGGSHSGLASVFARQPRPGRRDALIWTNSPTPMLALDLTFMHTDFRDDVEVVLRHFRALISGDEAVLLHGVSPSWAGPWFVTDATEEIQDLTPRNKIAKAVVHTTFTRVDKSNLAGTGPIVGGTKAHKGGTTTYTVKKGDTLPGIAARQLGDASLYGMIAQINNLRSTKIHPGQKLKLPDMGKNKGDGKH